MSLAVERPDELGVDELVELLWQIVKDGRAPTISAALRLVWCPNLTVEAYETALFQGIVSIAHNRQSERRVAGRPAIAFGAPHGRAWEPYLATLATPFQAADGTEKSLLDFKDVDWAFYVADCHAMIAGWQARRDAAQLARRLLRKHGVVCTRDLPVEALLALGEKFDKAFA